MYLINVQVFEGIQHGTYVGIAVNSWLGNGSGGSQSDINTTLEELVTVTLSSWSTGVDVSERHSADFLGSEKLSWGSN